MRWPAVLAAVVTAAETDAGVLAALEGEPRIYPSDDTRAGGVPSVSWTLISDTDEENTERLLVQWDVFARSVSDGIAIERALRRRVTSEEIAEMDGVRMWMLFRGGRGHPAPARGEVHRSLDVLYQPARESL